MAESTSIAEEFNVAVNTVRNSNMPIPMKDKLVLYALMKQALSGDCLRPEPAAEAKLARAKWIAWKNLKGIDSTTAMKRYLEQVEKINNKERTFLLDSSQVVKNGYNPIPAVLIQQADNEFAELPSSKPVHAPKSLVDVNRLSMISGINPINHEGDELARVELHERLTRFYLKHNKQLLAKGIGHLVDYALEKGEEKMNIKLKKQYGEDLDGMENEEERQRSVKTLRREENEQKIRMSIAEEEDSVRKSLQEKLVIFFTKHDPDRLESSFDVLYQYHKLRGSAKLNSKLFQKYGEDLDTMFPKEKSSMDMVVQMSNSKFNTPVEEYDEPLKRTPSALFHLPDGSYELLQAYYTKYEPQKVLDGSVDGVYKWGQRNGYDALNVQLYKRYGETLHSFGNMARQLDLEIRRYYTDKDPSAFPYIGKITTWALKNGRTAINNKLLKKYGQTLDDFIEGSTSNKIRRQGSNMTLNF